jgi:hypothetical protein
MNKDYIIIDGRPLEAFKDKTFSDFKKKDVLNSLFKSIDQGKTEEACFWCTECIVSGYCEELFEKLIIYNSKNIHINNPKLPILLYRKYNDFINSYNHIPKKEKDKLIHLRNTQSIRNLLFDIVTTFITSPKKNKLINHDKIKDDDFQFTNIKNKLKATMQILPTNTIRFTDPEELKIIMNEFFFHLKNTNGGYYDACYWVNWLIQWEKYNKKLKKKYEIENRNINNVNPKYHNDCIWLIWEIIFKEASTRNDIINKIIQNIYSLFINNYTPAKKNTRISLIHHAIACLTFKINTKSNIRNNKDIFIQTQCNINIMFKNKKSNEISNYIHIPKINNNNNNNNNNYNNEINISKSKLLY